MKYCLQQICNYLSSLSNSANVIHDDISVFIICFSYVGVYLHIDEVVRSDHKNSLKTHVVTRSHARCEVSDLKLSTCDWIT